MIIAMTNHMIRGLLLLSLLLHGFWIAWPSISSPESPELAELLRWTGFGGSAWALSPIYQTAVLFAKLLAAIALVCGFAWGRWIFLAALVAGLLAVPFSGFNATVGLEALIGAMLAVTDGMIVAAVFLVSKESAHSCR